MGKRARVLEENTLESFNAELTKVLKSGKYALGSFRAMKALVKDKAKVVIITRKVPPKIKCDFEYHTSLSKIKLLHYPGNTIELRRSDGKQIRVSVLSVTDPGNSNIMKLLSSNVKDNSILKKQVS